MSSTVKLSSKLAASEELNGLDNLATSLRENPEQVIVSICWFDVKSIVHDVDSGEDVPTVRLRRVEPIDVVEKIPDAVMKLAAELFEKRTGRRPLPFDVVEYEEQGYVDPE